jgi:hypothetical protein
MDFIQSIPSRSTEELIAIAHSGPGEWQEEAVTAARLELARRHITQQQQEEVLQKWQRQQEAWEAHLARKLENNVREGFSPREMLRIVAGAPFYITGHLEDTDSLHDLRIMNYRRKFRQRILLLLAGLLLWTAMGTGAFFLLHHQHMQEIENADISKWEENRITE